MMFGRRALILSVAVLAFAKQEVHGLTISAHSAAESKKSSQDLSNAVREAAAGSGCKAFKDGSMVGLLSMSEPWQLEDLSKHPYLWCATLKYGDVKECYNLHTGQPCDGDENEDQPESTAIRAHNVYQFLLGVVRELDSNSRGTFLFHDQDLTLTASLDGEKLLFEGGTPLVGFSTHKNHTSIVPMPRIENMADGLTLAEEKSQDTAVFSRELCKKNATAQSLQSKTRKAFWRGSPVGFFGSPDKSYIGYSVRHDLVKIAHNECPNLIDAQMLGNIGQESDILYDHWRTFLTWRKEGSLLYFDQEKFSSRDMIKNAILLEMDDFSTTDDFFWKAASDSIIVRLDAGMHDWYSRRLVEGKHFFSVDATRPVKVCILVKDLLVRALTSEGANELAQNIAERQKVMQSMTPAREARRLAHFFDNFWANQAGPRRWTALEEYLSGPELPYTKEDLKEAKDKFVRMLD